MPTSADVKLVALLEVELRGRARRQLEDAARAPHEPHHSIPRRQLRVHLLHAFLAVQENRVDRKPHEQHVDAAALARVDPHPPPWFERAPEHEADATPYEGPRHLQLLREQLAVARMDR